MNDQEPEVLEPEVIRPGEDEDDGDDILRSFDGLGEDATTTDIWRRNSITRKYEYIENISLGDFSLDLVAQQYGGGDYQVRPKHASGRYVVGARRVFSVEGAPRTARTAQPAEGAPEQLATLTKLVQEMTVEMRARNADAGAPMTLALEMAKAMGEAGRVASTEMREMMALRDDSGRLDPLDLLERVMSLQDRLGGGGGGDGGSDGVVRQLAGELLTVFRDNRSQSARPPAAAGVAEAANPPPGAPAPAPDPGRPAWAGMLGPYVPTLIGLAVRGRDPGVYATVIQDQLPDGALDMLAFVLTGPEFADEFFLQFPDALPHRTWFARLFEALREDLTDMEAENESIDDVPAPAQGVPEAEAEPGPSEPDGAGVGRADL